VADGMCIAVALDLYAEQPDMTRMRDDARRLV